MVDQQTPVLRPETLLEEFKKNGVTHIITIPDSETNYLYELMVKQDWLDVVPASREGETMAIALGLIYMSERLGEGLGLSCVSSRMKLHERTEFHSTISLKYTCPKGQRHRLTRP